MKPVQANEPVRVILPTINLEELRKKLEAVGEQARLLDGAVVRVKDERGVQR